MPHNAQPLGFVTLATITLLAAATIFAQTPPPRTVTTNNFYLTWDTGADAEAITTLRWLGGPNLTGSNNVDTCGNSTNDVEYFGNSEAPPDPQSGGLVLVGGGTVTPPGTLPWRGPFALPENLEVKVGSSSANCAPASVGIDVQTDYRFFDPRNSNRFAVQRVFDFKGVVFPFDFRPYIPRLSLAGGFTEVLYPTPAGTLETMNVYNCPGGCTGPQSAPGAAPLTPLWDPLQGWYAIHNPTTLQGVVVRRVASLDPQGHLTVPQLWIDNDQGSNTNASSFLLISPSGGFNGGLLTEVETFCFYDSTIWTPSLLPPPECRIPQISLFPWSLTFAAHAVGTSSAPLAATVKNVGATPVAIAEIVVSGEFSQTNDCPASLAPAAQCTIAVVFTPTEATIQSGTVSIIDALSSSPQSLALAGLGAVPR